MSSKVSKETLYESVHAVLQVMKRFLFLSRPAVPFFSDCFCIPEPLLSGIQGQAEEVPGDCGPPDWSEELRPPEGQAFLWHRQV